MNWILALNDPEVFAMPPNKSIQNIEENLHLLKVQSEL